ncbi:MAG: peptide MFS transporter [Planctomycetaceae bacterium]|jgi:POT family proton-dependent oligopeptide transporter|nr:peptide MFS transporter [Planctomycetaceae bacterium]
MSNDNNVLPRRHPAGLWVLFTTEMWERFAFYAMRAILVLYLYNVSTDKSTPGFGWSESDAYKLYGWYTGLVYISPLLGGWIADRFLGQRFCVMVGAVLMVVGEFFLAATEFVRIGGGVKITFATDPTALIIFYVGLGLMVLGNGFFKPCISVMVGQLYAQGDRKRDDAFYIFYMGINIGAFFSPLVAGTIAEKYGYHWGFLIAGLGMICGLLSFTMLGQKYLKGIGTAPTKHDPNKEMTPEESEKHVRDVYEQKRPLDKKDWDRIFVLMTLSVLVIAFWLSFEQAGSSLNVFAKKNTDRSIAQSVVDISPKIAVKFYIQNEYLVEYEAAVSRLEVLANSSKKPNNSPPNQPQQDPKKEDSTNQDSTNQSKDQTATPSFSLVVDQKDQSILRRYPDIVRRGVEVKKRLSGSDDVEVRSAIKELEGMETSFGGDFVPAADSYTFPATWYQSVNAFGIVIFAPLATMLWVFLSRRGIEPSTPTKFAIGLLLVSASFFVMIPGAVEAKVTGKAAFYWLLLCYLFATWGELCLSPVGLSMITKLAPVRYASLFMGVWFLASSVAYVMAGQMASYFGSGDGISFFYGEKSGLADFFLLMAFIPMVIGFIALALVPTLKRKMHGIG